MTLGAFLVLSGLLLVYGAITDQNALDAVRSVFSGSTATTAKPTTAKPAAPPPAPTVGQDVMGGGTFP